MFVACCVGSGLCDWLTTSSEESYGCVCVSLCDAETSTMRRPTLDLGCGSTKNWNNTAFHSSLSYSFPFRFSSCKHILVYFKLRCYISAFASHISKTFQFRNRLFSNLTSISRPQVSDTLLWWLFPSLRSKSGCLRGMILPSWSDFVSANPQRISFPIHSLQVKGSGNPNWVLRVSGCFLSHAIWISSVYSHSR
jgi:hypothetical protein